MKNYIKAGAVALAMAAAFGCTEGDKFEPGREIVVFTGTDYSPLIRTNAESYPLTVSATGIVSEDVTVTFKYDQTALDEYNASHKTSYVAVPESYVNFESRTATIAKGSSVSEPTYVTITDKSYVEDGYIYVLPLRLEAAEGSSCEILGSSSTLLLRSTNTFTFYALDVDNPDLSSNYIFPDEKAIELSTYTYEIKFYAYSLKETGTDQICRMCAWEGKGEEKANMLRFGENGYEGHSLQLVSPAGNIVSNTLFDPGQWYMLSLVYDGSTMTMYVNGVAEEAKGTNDGTTTFQRFELGMSWGGYNTRQLFSGRICEIRVWDRALSVSEMQEGICKVAAASDGLRCYWKLDQSEGHIFTDATGNGYDMDWSNTQLDANGDGVMENADMSSFVKWVFDESNTCSN